MSDAPAPIRAEGARTDESGRTMRVMLSDEMRRRLKHGERVVIVRDIPWELFGEAGERQSENNHGQSLTRISERGGFHATEAVCVLTSMAWREGKTITEEQAHRILYAMAAFYRRGVLAARDATARAEAEVARLTAENERMREACLKAAISASYGPPSSWPGDYPRGWRHPPCWDEGRKPTPDEAAWHDNGARDAWFAIRALSTSGEGGGDDGR